MNPFPSSLLQALQMRRGELPEAQQRVVDVLLQAPQAAVGATVEQLAQRAGVSMPTVVRTCRSFGHDSVREFMLVLAQDIALDASYLHRSVVADDTAGDIVGKIIRSATASMKSRSQGTKRMGAALLGMANPGSRLGPRGGPGRSKGRAGGS